MGDWDPERHTAAGVVDPTPDELARCRVRLADLPGLDPVGLWLIDAKKQREHIALYVDEHEVLVHSTGSDDEAWWWTREDPSVEPFVTTTDASTRDRLARWVAERVGKPAGPTGPCFGAVANSYDGGGWGLLAKLGHGMCIFMRPDWLPIAALPPLTKSGESVWVGVPALTDLDPRDARLLPDGSRWVDAAALAEVARHIGSYGTVEGG